MKLIAGLGNPGKEYENDVPKRVDTIVISTQHSDTVELETIRKDLKKYEMCIRDSIEEGYFNEFDETGLFQNHDLNHCDFPYETKYKENHIMSTIQKKIEYDGHFYGIVGMNKKSRQVWNIKDVLLIENMACAFSTYFESWRKQD